MINIIQIQAIIWETFQQNKVIPTLRKQINYYFTVKPLGKLTLLLNPQ